MDDLCGIGCGSLVGLVVVLWFLGLFAYPFFGRELEAFTRHLPTLCCGFVAGLIAFMARLINLCRGFVIGVFRFRPRDAYRGLKAPSNGIDGGVVTPSSEVDLPRPADSLPM